MSRASDTAYARIRSMILSGALLPGTQLREEHLAEECGVSRTPVREALRRLETELFIRRNDSQRTFVADWSPDDMEDAFELRTMLEARAAKRAATRINEEQLDRLRGHNSAILEAVDRTKADVSAFLEHNRQFHATVLEAAGSKRLASLMVLVVERPVVVRTALRYDRKNLLRSHHEHDELLAAFAHRDATWAEAVMTSHIRRAFHTNADAEEASRVVRKRGGSVGG